MRCNGVQIVKDSTKIKLILLSVLSCFFCEVALSQGLVTGQTGDKNIKSEQQKALEEELMKLIQQGVDSKTITEGLRDTIMQFIRSTNALSSSKFLNFNNSANKIIYDSLPSNKEIVMRDGVPIVVDKNLSGKPVLKKDVELSLDKSMESTLDRSSSLNIKNGINSSMLYPDKLPVPERDSKNRYQYMTQEELKRNIIRIDYFSKGIDGYYKKLIEMGYIGQGWEETRQVREAMDRMKASIMANLADLNQSSDPEFIDDLCKSRNPFKQILGGLLMMFNNGAKSQIRSGYQNPNPMIRTAPVGYAPVPSTK